MAEKQETNFQLLAEHSADVICRVGLDMKLLYVSPSSFKVLGYTPEEMLEMPPYSLIVPEDVPALAAAANSNLAPGAEPSLMAVRTRTKSGKIIWVEVSARVLRDPGTLEPLETIIILRDITERKMLEEKLSSLALTDELTGLANRRAFDQALDREWKRTLREGSQISLLLLDVDFFKSFNDKYGHQVGDDCLRAIAITLRTALRATDIPARYGGEELAIILPSTDAPGAVEVAEKVRAAIEDLKFTPSQPEAGTSATASIGVATALARFGGTTRMPESLLLAADTALYKAKREGRNRIESTLLVASQDS